MKRPSLRKKSSRGVPRANRRRFPSDALVNVTRSTLLAERCSILRDPFRQAIGTMFRTLDHALVFVWWRTGRIAITNLFVPTPIDVLWLDERRTVVTITQRFPAGALRTVNTLPARYVIEVPAGTVERTGTRVGDVLAWPERV